MTRIATFFACDQVGQAGLGKLAYVGVYNGDMWISKLPFKQEQLFFVVRFRSPIDDPPTKLAVRIERPGEEPFTLDQTASLVPTGPPSPDAKFWSTQIVARIAPFEIREEGTARVFVIDEREEHYAGGLRLKHAVHPESRLPQFAQAVDLTAAHYRRLEDASSEDRRNTAVQLIEALSSFAIANGLPAKLQFPDADVRLELDEQRMHVFFPKPLQSDAYEVMVEPSTAFESSHIERKDHLGFVVRFEPAVPPGGTFNYEVASEIFPTSRKPRLESPSSSKARKPAKKPKK